MSDIQTLRDQYRRNMIDAGYEGHAEAFKNRVYRWLAIHEFVGRRASDASKITPEQWVRGSEGVAWEEEMDAGWDEGYMGTGMSEAAYFTALGSAEFGGGNF
jgi:hypothetical protein